MFGFRLNAGFTLWGHNSSWIDSTSLLQFDFVNNRAALGGQETSLSELLVCSRPSTAWVLDGVGRIKEFAPNQPRLTDKGLLVWREVEQLIDPDLRISSQALSNSVTLDDGFYRIEKTASGPYKYSKLSFTGVAERVRAELTLKGGSGDGLTLGIYDFNTGAFVDGQINILSGPGTISNFGSGRWFVTGLSASLETKIEIVSSAPLVQGNSCALLLYVGLYNSAPSGKVVYVKEAMVHVGTNPVPPMPQKGVVAADNISVDLSGLDLSSGFYGVMDIEQIWQDSASGSEKMLQIGLDT
ncbi:MAG: hypothetical protein OIF58_11035, partial [Cohaesibacter sp.]|nr:hypothetical protein [Cohaesibacter sp.]